MIHLRLCDEDRKRLGVDEEWLDVDLWSVTAREAAVMQRGFDLGGENVAFEHPGIWRKALATPNQFGAWVVLVWLALRRHGLAIALIDVDFNMDLLGRKEDEESEPEVADDPDASPGKDGEPEPSPSDSDASTTSAL